MSVSKKYLEFNFLNRKATQKYLNKEKERELVIHNVLIKCIITNTKRLICIIH